jgi:hypothetical protein
LVPAGTETLSFPSRHQGREFRRLDFRGPAFYETAAKNGKRVQALCEAKNHALVLEDAPIERTAAGIINSAFGCAGEGRAPKPRPLPSRRQLK